jgi:type IV secretory pathway VirB2 component (pilin)
MQNITRHSGGPAPTGALAVIRSLTPYLGVFLLAVLGGTVTLFAASASSTAVPWDAAMANMIGILTGGTARFLAAIMFIGGALMWGFSRNEDGMQTIAKVIMAAGLIIGCLTLTDFLFGAVV